jgi:membrane-associated phospholipid phosphatase
MKIAIHTRAPRFVVAASMLACLALDAHADVITDWNTRAGELIIESKIGTPPAVRVMAIVQSAVHEAVNAVKQGNAAGQQQASTASVAAGESDASVDAAVASANRVTLTKLLPSQQSSVETAYQAALTQIAEGPAKAAGLAIGEKAAVAVLARRADDGAASAESHRPYTSAGTYVPTATPAVTQWPQRKPWLMTSAAQFRPGPPPALTSDVWARDYNEVKTFGAKNSVARSVEQAEIARFWEYSLPPIYFGVVRSVANTPGRDVAQNSRVFAAVAQAMDDAMIGVFDAKYHYNFWRPVTAIRNGDIDGNEATQRDATWVPFIEAPMHPEYPSAHSILAAAVATILTADIGKHAMTVLTTTSPTAKGATRRWANLDDFTREVGNARVYEGIHYRTSTEVGIAMGKQIGELTVQKFLQLPD